ncbi:hypothetical protein [Sulfuriferula nivalis]|uniref:Uncharacterized protein n=1 Tax=Sulfuriferula nivalis TaxID=2675298 RepID=A0A809RIR9_9PROT|nr:hypothetical protein [Sulfuriferula nivalis]BBP00734.1 hypothetical protein SFSGTM_14420 [Sulfuriferula nivalis]
MSISSVSSATQHVTQVQANTQQVKTQRDSDGDNDKSRAGEVEKSKVNVPTTATVGNNINTSA